MAEPDLRLIERRPLSPHLSIYRPLLTMMMSIAHRITGAALYFGVLLVAWWFIAAASGPESFQAAQWAVASIPGRVVLFGMTWALFHHLLGGVRHAIWDAGYGMDKTGREFLAAASLGGGLLLTVLAWAIAYFVR